MKNDPSTEPVTEQQRTEYLRERRFARESAVQFIYQLDVQQNWELDDRSVDTFWEQIVELENCPAGKRLDMAKSYTTELVTGVVEHREQIDRRIGDTNSNWSIERMDVIDRNILRLAVFEMFHRDDVPGLVTINEAIELAKEFGGKESARFVNGVLDQLYTERRKAEGGGMKPET